MRLTIKDTWIRHGEVDIGRGDDHLIFERCIFVGGTVKVDPEIDRKIFVGCLFEERALPPNPFAPGSPSIAIGNKQTQRTHAPRKDLLGADLAAVFAL